NIHMNAQIAALHAAETVEIAGQVVPRHYGSAADEFAAAHEGVVVIRRSHEGRVRALGRDRLDLLHRMSTNDLATLAVGEARPSYPRTISWTTASYWCGAAGRWRATASR